MKEKLEQLEKEALQQLEKISDLKLLNDLRVKYLGKKGQLSAFMRNMKDLSAEERPQFGKIVNRVRSSIENRLTERQQALQQAETEKRLQEEKIDVTLPGRNPMLGTVHPINKIIQTIEDIFLGMGYKVAEGPEVETDYYNFEALNLPKNHPGTGYARFVLYYRRHFDADTYFSRASSNNGANERRSTREDHMSWKGLSAG